MIRPLRSTDAAAIVAIYNHYIEKTTATFEEVPFKRAEMLRRMKEVTAEYPWFVAEENKRVLGYAYANKWKARPSYRFSVETTVYLSPDALGRGLGTALYSTLIDELRKRSIHSVIGGVALPNPASQALHEKLGFEKVAHFRQVGWKFERWIDVGYWQLLLR